jgi:uncharacterized protein
VSPLRTAVVAGASGYVGRHLTRTLDASGIRVRTIGRGPEADARWGDDRGLTAVLDGADLLVNLAGRSVSCRYSKRNADAILSSRTETTAALGRALARAEDPPALWVNASTGTIYRDARDRPQDEATGELGRVTGRPKRTDRPPGRGTVVSRSRDPGSRTGTGGPGPAEPASIPRRWRS